MSTPTIEKESPVSSINEKDKDAGVFTSVEEAQNAGLQHFLDGTKDAATAEDIEDVLAAAHALSIEDARQILEDTIAANQLDPNYPQALLDRARLALDTKDLSSAVSLALIEEIKIEAALIDDSPYPEVRAVVSNTDDPTIPVGTFRVWFIGIFFTIIGTGLNTFFSTRYPAITFGASIVQVLSYPMAKAFELFPARWTFLNPGPFSQKEHMLLTIIANCGLGGAYITYIIFAYRIEYWYNDQALGSSAGFQVLLSIATQVMGFSIAGLTRRFLVYPPALIWPANLAQIALNRSFHGGKNHVANGWKITRFRFFMTVFVAYLLWYPVSNIAFQAITYFNWPTWIAPDNVNLAVWMGNFAAFGLNPVSSFDWSWLTAFTDPTITPLWSTLNQTFGFFFFGIILIPAVWYNNLWETGYFPMITNGVHDRFGHAFNVSRIITDGVLDQAKYESYSRAYLGAGNAIAYGVFFAFYTAGIMHGFLYHRDIIGKGFASFRSRGSSRKLYTDVHNRLMAVYPEVPEWWFGVVFLATLVMGIVHAEIYHTLLPVWSIFFAVAMAAVFILPVGIITAVSNVQITFNVLGELIGGYAIPGKPLANMLFKTYSVEVPIQAIRFAEDLKLGHYLKIKPRLMFWAQLIPTIISAIVAVGVTDWQLTNIEGMCTPTQPDRFYCYGPKSFYTASVIWGLIGPQRNYSFGGLYYACTFGFLIGAILPIGPYFLARKYPRSIWKYVHIPAMLSLVLSIAPHGGSWVLGSLTLALIFQFWIRRSYLAWWIKYNYVGTTAMNASLALGAFFWFFALQYKDVTPDWWGNSVSNAGCDGGGCALLTVPKDPGYFGAASGWH